MKRCGNGSYARFKLISHVVQRGIEANALRAAICSCIGSTDLWTNLSRVFFGRDVLRKD
jgi:hypothetical protein